MNYYNLNLGAELAKGISISFGSNLSSSKKEISIHGYFNTSAFDQYIKQLYGSDFPTKSLECMTYYDSGNNIPATYYVFEIFRNIFLEYNQENPSLSEYKPKNYLEHSKKLEAYLSQTRDRLGTICKFPVSETDSDFSAIETYLNFIDSRLNKNGTNN